MTLGLMVAVDKHGGFAKNGEIPWFCSRDLKHFRSTTKRFGNCVMGRVTYQDLLARRNTSEEALEKIKSEGILPDRVTYVVTSSTDSDSFPGAVIVPDLRKAIEQTEGSDLMVCGGEQLYIQALATVSEAYVTVIPKSFKCDRFFPVSVLAKDFILDTTSSETDECDVDGEATQVAFIKYTRR